MELPTSTRHSTTGWPWTNSGEFSVGHNETWPKISIITPSFNQGRFIEQTIRSVLLQNYPNLEYIIIDGGSTDETLDVISKYSPWITHWTSEKDNGQADALNKGFRMATGDIFAWINSDDYYERDALFTVARRFKQKPFDFFCGTSKMIAEDGHLIQELYTEKIDSRTLLNYWKPHFCPPQPSLFFQKNVFIELGELNVDLRYAMDYDFWLRGSSKFRFETQRVNLSYYRIHNDSKTGSGIGFRKFIPEWRTVIKKHLRSQTVSNRLIFRLHELFFQARNIARHLSFRGLVKTSIRAFSKKIKWQSGSAL